MDRRQQRRPGLATGTTPGPRRVSWAPRELIPMPEARWTLTRSHPMTTSFDGPRLALGESVEVVPASQLAQLRYLMWKCHCAASDGVPVPFDRWLADGGPEALPSEIQEL